MNMRQNTKRIWWLTAAAVTIVGCAHSEYPVGRQMGPGLKSPRNPGILEVEDEKPPKILPETHFAAAMLFERQGAVDKAIAQYRKTVALNHHHLAAYHRLGLMLSAVGQHDEAVQALRRAVELKPDHAVIRNNLGFEYMLTQRWEDAERELRQAVALQPEFRRAHINLGMTLAKLGVFDDALASFQQALPEPDAYYNLGLMFRGQQRYPEALEAFRQVLAIAPGFSAARVQWDEVAARMAPPEASLPPAETAVAQAAMEIPSQATPPAELQPVPDSVIDAPSSTELADVFGLIDAIFASRKTEPEPIAQTQVATMEQPAEAPTRAFEEFIEETHEPCVEQPEPAHVAVERTPVVEAPVVQLPGPEPTPSEFLEETPETPEIAPDLGLAVAVEDDVREVAELDADEVIADAPTTPPTPAAARDSWIMLAELESKIGLLRDEIRTRDSQFFGPSAPANPFGFYATGEPTPTPAVVEYFEEDEPDDENEEFEEAPVVEFNEDDETDSNDPTTQRLPENALPCAEEPAPSSDAFDWSATFGDLEALLSVVINESRCWQTEDGDAITLRDDGIEFIPFDTDTVVDDADEPGDADLFDDDVTEARVSAQSPSDPRSMQPRPE